MQTEILKRGHIECWNCGIHYDARKFMFCPDCRESMSATTPEPARPTTNEAREPVIHRRLREEADIRAAIAEQESQEAMLARQRRRQISRVELIDDEEPTEVTNTTIEEATLRNTSTGIEITGIDEEMREMLGVQVTPIPPYGFSNDAGNYNPIHLHTPNRIYNLDESSTVVIDSNTAIIALPINIAVSTFTSMITDEHIEIEEVLIDRAIGTHDNNRYPIYSTREGYSFIYPNVYRITYIRGRSNEDAELTVNSAIYQSTEEDEDEDSYTEDTSEDDDIPF